MSNKLKVIGLAGVVAIVALSAIVTAGLADEKKYYFQAQYTVEEDEIHTDTIDQLGIFEAVGTNDTFQAFGATFTCAQSEFTGEIAAFGSPTMSVAPHYSGCKGLEGNLLATITTNSCVYSFTLGEKVGMEDTYELSTDINCKAGGKIEIHVYASQGADNEKKSLCTLTIGEQKGLKGLHAKVNTGPDPTDVTISGVLKEIAVTQDKNWIFCPGGAAGKAEYEIGGEKGVTFEVKNEINETIDYTINQIGA